MDNSFDLVIIGRGAAGLSAGIYAGRYRLKTAVVSREFGGETTLAGKIENYPGFLGIGGLFVEIGADPNAVLAKELGVELDERGYIKVDNRMKTNVDGVFAAGDITNHFGAFKQDITAAALGAMAATSAYEDHKVHGELCVLHAVPAQAPLN